VRPGKAVLWDLFELNPHNGGGRVANDPRPRNNTDVQYQKINTTQHPGLRMSIRRSSKKSGGRGHIGEIFLAQGRFRPLASSFLDLDFREFPFHDVG